MQEGFAIPIVLSLHFEETGLSDESKMKLGTLGLTLSKKLLKFSIALQGAVD
ncbi:hypothetical protein ACQ4M3_24940 [Leptolyngbya sp. AN03gr2]|uniref:hypothetical protein n=1 Tax=unclassified Leptolyngbya TaxID=2650499 RepID=UPI003D31F73A